jgi:hypothetical protein
VPNRAKLAQAYGKLLDTTARVTGQAKRFAGEINDGVKCAANALKQPVLEGRRAKLDATVPLVQQVMRQTRARVFAGDTHAKGKIVSVFEPTTEIIRKGQAGKPTEFGKMVKLPEAENQIVVEYEVYDRRPSDADLLIPAIATHQARLVRARTWSPPTPASTPPKTRPRPKPKGSNASPSPIAPARARPANASRTSAGFATARNGEPVARAASA